jgi:hypothetical protein
LKWVWNGSPEKDMGGIIGASLFFLFNDYQAKTRIATRNSFTILSFATSILHEII